MLNKLIQVAITVHEKMNNELVKLTNVLDRAAKAKKERKWFQFKKKDRDAKKANDTLKEAGLDTENEEKVIPRGGRRRLPLRHRAPELRRQRRELRHNRRRLRLCDRTSGRTIPRRGQEGSADRPLHARTVLYGCHLARQQQVLEGEPQVHERRRAGRARRLPQAADGRRHA